MTAFRAGEVCLGWQYLPSWAEPGPPPRRPPPPAPERLDPGWRAAQRREERLLSRPARVSLGVWLALLCAVMLAGLTGLLPPPVTGAGAAACAAVAARHAHAVWRGRAELRAVIGAEQRRVTVARAIQQRQQVIAQADYAASLRAWQQHARAFAAQPVWRPVALPGEIDRVDVLGGTLAGWSALLTTVGLSRLATGGEITALDLSEGAVARDLVTLAGEAGLRPLVWLLPSDLPRFDLGAGLPAADLAEVLAATAGASRGTSGDRPDPAADHAILARVLAVLGDGAAISGVLAALRALGQVGDPRADVAAGLLTAGQLEQVTGLFGRGAADRVVIERAWALEARLRGLAALGTDPVPLPPSRLRVVALGRGGGAFGNTVLGAYAVVSLTHLLRQARRGRPWHHTLCLTGAERVPGDVLDRLAAACEYTATGLVLAFRSAPAHVKERLGTGNAALAVMRLGNADDAKAASEQIGTEHRFVISQFTDTVGASVSDTAGDSYTSTVGTSASWSASVSTSLTSGRSRGRGYSRAGPAPFASRTGSGSREASESRGTSDSESITAGINDSTSWGVSTSRALSASDSLARTAARSREFLVEAQELQQLPASAVIVSYASAAGRQVVLADANPAISTLPGPAPAAPGPWDAPGSPAAPGSPGPWDATGSPAAPGPWDAPGSPVAPGPWAAPGSGQPGTSRPGRHRRP